MLNALPLHTHSRGCYPVTLRIAGLMDGGEAEALSVRLGGVEKVDYFVRQNMCSGLI